MCRYLRSQDWSKLLSVANQTVLSKDQVVITEGQQYQQIFYVVQGAHADL
jgi:hypothetical protein